MKNSPETERKIDELLSRMTLEEKLLQMQQVSCEPGYEEDFARFVRLGGGSFLHVLSDQADEIRAAAAATEHKIPPIFGIDAIHGHSLLNGAVIFPSQLAVACSWNPELIGKMGRVTAEEVNADGLDWVFSPVLCLGRDTRWGRVDETFGEDAYLAGELGAAIVDGYERDGLVVACLKHYIGYGEATGARDSYDTEVTERKIREVFLRPFRRAIEAGAGTVMTAYGSIDGLPLTCHRRLLREVLKDELGFEGFVVTDWNNIKSLCTKQMAAETFEEATEAALEAGNDMSMNSFGFYDAALSLARAGKLSEEVIDDAVRRILRVKFSLGMFDPDKKRLPRSVIGSPEHIEINRRLTCQSMVLLENNGVLPIKGTPKRIAVIGPNADDLRAQYGDWTFFSHPKPKDKVDVKNDYYTALRGIKTVFADSEVLHLVGCGITESESDDRTIAEAVAAARECDLIVYVPGDCLAQNGEHKDRADLVLSGRQNELARLLHETGVPMVSLLVIGKPLCIGELAQNTDALICAFNGGDLGGLAAAELIAGKFSPSGKLPISFPRHPAQIPCYYNELPGWHGGKYMDVERGPLYPFGYGLSYTKFEYSDLALSSDVAADGDTVEVSVTVTNIGECAGDEIVELYVNDLVSTILTPVRELRGFERISLEAGESRRVTLSLPISELALVYPDGRVAVEPGKFEIMVGGNPAELLSTTLTVK